MLKKRGISHVEIILSFILFISAIGVGFYFLNPGNTQRIADSSLEYAFREIAENATTVLINFGFKINNEIIRQDEEQNRGSIDTIAIKISQYSGMKSKVISSNDIEFESEIENDVVYIKAGTGGWTNVEFVNIFLNEEFIDDEVSAVAIKEQYYSLASSQKEEMISEKKFRRLVGIYNLDYYGLKKEFNFPDRANFGFSMRIGDEEIVAQREIPEKTEVFSGSKDFPILKENGEQGFGTLIVSVW